MLISFEKGNVSLYFIKHMHCPYICTRTVCSVCRGLHGSTGSRAHRRVPAPRACGCQREALGAAPRGRPGGGPIGRLCPRSQGTPRWVSACRGEAGRGEACSQPAGCNALEMIICYLCHKNLSLLKRSPFFTLKMLQIFIPLFAQHLR